MELLYKQEWPEAQERLRAFWANDALDRPAIGVTAPRDEPLPGPEAPPLPADLPTRWTNAGSIVARADWGFRHTYYGGEAVPSVLVNLGPGILAAYLGSRPTFGETTVWFGPLEDFRWDHLPVFDPADEWWQLTRRLTQASAEAFAGKALTAVTDLGDASDALAALRGTQELLLDLALNPEGITAWVRYLTGLWMGLFGELHAIAQDPEGGSLQWLGLWAPGPMYAVASDFACMVSPAMFDRYLVSDIETLCEHLDYTLFHLDGPEALPHLDRLLAIPRLGGIQWTPGAGNPPTCEWLPMLRKVQAAGKRLHVHDTPENAERILRGLRPEGLYLQTWAPDEACARELLQKATAWAAGPRQS